MADIVSRIPFQISNFGGSGVGGSYNLQDSQFDYALGGIPFLSATRDAWPYNEGMAEIRKQQFDSSAEPGEQSIYGWWLRSQSNFTGGAGIIYQDPDTQNPYIRAFDLRFADSLGVDNWTSGQLQLLRQPDNRFTATSSFNRVSGYVDPSGVDAAFYMDGNQLFKLTDAGRTAITNPSAGTMLDFTSTGTRYFILATDGIWTGIDTAAAVKMYSPPSGTLTSGTIGFVKNRLVWAYNNSLYSGAIQTAGLPVASPTSFYSHTDPNWTWNSVAEGPTAYYLSGRNSTHSDIFKFVIDFSTASGAAVEFVLPTITATMPSGERINTIYSYVGSFMGIATTRGFRVGEFDSNGDVIYGPLLFQPTGGCQSIVGYDRFMWVGSTNAPDGQAGMFRVDLSMVLQVRRQQGVRYHHSRDLFAPSTTGTVVAIGTFGATDRKVFMVQSNSIWVENATTLYPSGYLRTG